MTPSENPADWSDLQRLLEAGLKLPLDERPAWLAGLPPQHDLLREPLRRLLEVQAGIQTRPFIDAFTNGIECLTPPATVIVGDVVGPYRLLQQLGDGGMGSVWLAERADGTLKRRVALKLPRMVWARDLSARMARERDILGSLEHPNIARLYDAGVDQFGRPFLALENVEGERIDQYCDDQKLSVDSRIRLFLQVLDAVDYAHVNLVLHRDLKPGNVLVNQRGEVRLLDFGIAKLMGEDESPLPVDQNSRTLARAMTPRYASPEQVQHLRLTLASDVYSLGVMLYELLVGSSPLITQKGSRAEIETAILEGYLKTPSRARIDESIAVKRSTTPSRLSRSLRGDLDAVLLKALARNVADRYPSVDAFRTDLIRWLDERPVFAKPPSRISAIRKFVVRNAVAVSIGSVATCAVIAATVIAIFQAQEARLESRRAAATRDFLIGLFENANPELHGGRDVSAKHILESAELKLQDSSGFDVELKTELYATIASLWAFLGDFDRARRVTQKRLESLAAIGPTSLKISALCDLAEIAVQLESADDLASALNELSVLKKKVPFSLAQSADHLWYGGWHDLNSGDFDSSVEKFSSAIRLAREMDDKDRILRSIYGKLMASMSRGNRREAIDSYQEGKSLLTVLKLTREDRLRRELEMVSALYHLGEYTYGWPIISALFIESKEIHGDFNPSQQSLYFLWGLWAVRMGKAEEVLDWLKARAHKINSSSYETDFDANMRYGLLEVEALIEASDSAAVRPRLSEWLAAKERVSNKTQLLLSVLSLEARLAAGEIEDFEKELAGPVWSEMNDVGLRSDWAGYKIWYEGVRLFINGEISDSIEQFRRARVGFSKELGSSHPKTLMASFNEVLGEIIEETGSDQNRKKLDELKSIVDELAVRLPPETRVISKARSISDFVANERNRLVLKGDFNRRKKMVLH